MEAGTETVPLPSGVCMQQEHGSNPVTDVEVSEALRVAVAQHQEAEKKILSLIKEREIWMIPGETFVITKFNGDLRQVKINYIGGHT
jgi:hypothetical protein